MECLELRVFDFYTAPQEYQALSTHGGDEDYIIVVDKKFAESIAVERVVNALTVCDYSDHVIGDTVIYITAHA